MPTDGSAARSYRLGLYSQALIGALIWAAIIALVWWLA